MEATSILTRGDGFGNLGGYLSLPTPEGPTRDRFIINLRTARKAGVVAILLVAALEALNSFGCYNHGLLSYLGSLAFIAIPMLPALIAVFTANPIRAVGASMLFAPWLVFAFYTDCIRPYQGGGASMVYVVVVMYGFVTALIGALITGSVMRMFGVRVRNAA